jgi:NHL repeat
LRATRDNAAVRALIIAVLGMAALFASAAPASAGQAVDRVVVDANGTGHGELFRPSGIAFNDPTISDGSTDPQGASTDGYLYVVESTDRPGNDEPLRVFEGNGRVQVFDAAGNFKFMFGRGVLTGGDGGEVCDHTQIPCGASELFRDDEEGEFDTPGGIAINQQTGDVYVNDRGNRRVQQFEADGTFVRAWGWGVDTGADAFEICTAGCQGGAAGGNGGQFGEGGEETFPAIAVDPAAPHHVFVADGQGAGGPGRLHEYEADGDFVRLWGLGVVNSGQPGDRGLNVLEICASTAAGVCRQAPDGEELEDAGFGEWTATDFSFVAGPRGIAVDPVTRVVYVTDGASVPSGSTGILRFDTDETAPEDMQMPRIVGTAGAEQLRIDPQSGNLIASFEDHLREFDLGQEPPVEVDRHLVDQHLIGLRSKPDGFPILITGVDVERTTGDIYVSTHEHEGPARILAADEDGAEPPPTVTIEDPSPTVNGSNVTFTGTVNPGGTPDIPATYNFQYRKVGATAWITVPGSENPLGDGNAPIDVSDEVDDIEPAADYEVRLVARKAFGNPEVASAPMLFDGEPLPPEAETVTPAARSATAATLAAVIEPNNRATTYRFEWGTDTTYGNVVPVPAGDAGGGFGARLVTVRIVGLEPGTTYHYRVVADNGTEEAPGDTEVEGEDVSFTTRAIAPAAGKRGFEMVTPPFKITRATGHPQGRPGNNPNPAIPSLDGESLSWNVSLLPLTDDAAAPLTGDKRIIRRTPAGWVNETRNTLGLLDSTDPLKAGASSALFTKVRPGGSSGDLETFSWYIQDNFPSAAGLLPTEGKYANRTYTRRDGTGTKGFTPWLTNPEQQIVAEEFDPPGVAEEIIKAGRDQAIFDDAGTAMARWGHYRGVGEDPAVAGDEDPSDEQQLAGHRGGSSAYIQRAEDPDDLPSAPKELVNECTGSGASATRIPRNSAGEIASAACVSGNVTNVRGATVGNRDASGTSGPAATALSDGGDRLFFQSPDRLAATTATDSGSPHPSVSACSGATGTATACPPQLFVRQYDSSGKPTVRWISHSRSASLGGGVYGGAMIADQAIAQMGAGAAFQGASRNGGVVYFETNAPLTPDDPNGGTSTTTGSAHANSWDLYRYELPENLDSDPAGGTLMRVSGGPSGAADPDTTKTLKTNDATVRFHSDDGDRVYFLTTSPISGADETPPSSGSTSPGGAAGNNTTRNLYLFDAGASGADRWRFLARLPYAGDTDLDACASSGSQVAEQLEAVGSIGPVQSRSVRPNCFRGTPGGEAVLFATTGQLTADDVDDAADVYLYDAEEDELVRLSAPPMGEGPYICDQESPVGYCNGELGRNQGDGFFTAPIGPWDLSRGWGGMRYYNLSVDSHGVVSAYFATELALVAEDTNGRHMDVYEWRNGELSMISPPGTPDHSWFSGNSLDGEDVFFVTGGRIDPREIDDADQDVYDARIGGGFPYTPPPTPCQPLALECEGEAVPPPAAPSSATPGFQGPGNVKPKRTKCRKGKVRRKGRCVKRKARKARGKRAAGKGRRAGR